MSVRMVLVFTIFANNDFRGFDVSHLVDLQVEGEEEEGDEGDEEETVESLGKEEMLELKKLRSMSETWVCWSDGLHDISRVKHLTNDPYEPPEAPETAKKVDPFSLLCSLTERCLLCHQAPAKSRKKKLKGK